MRYRDAAAAINWLCEAFGFECQMAVPGKDDGMIMPGPVSNDNEYGKHLVQPDQIGGREFMCSDPEGHLWNIGTYDPWQPAQLSSQP
jgi:uncharacterized glyoxalase superfamily protein PhnB